MEEKKSKSSSMIKPVVFISLSFSPVALAAAADSVPENIRDLHLRFQSQMQHAETTEECPAAHQDRCDKA